MTTDGIIEKVNQPTDWVSSVQVVSKPSTEADGESKIRICLDPRDLNVAIKREHFRMPTIEEIASRLNGAKVFSVFDTSGIRPGLQFARNFQYSLRALPMEKNALWN